MKIKFTAPFNRTGYGIASVGYANGLSELLAKDSFKYQVIGEPEIGNSELTDNTNLLDAMNINLEGEYTNIIFWHFHDMERYIDPNARHNIGISTFETNQLTTEEIKTIHKLDAVGSATIWGASILESSGFIGGRLFVVPHAFKVHPSDIVPNLMYHNPVPKWQELLGPEIPNEVHVFSNCGKFEKRKGHFLLLDILPRLSKETLTVGFWHNPFIVDGYHFSALHSKGYEPIPTPTGLKLFRNEDAYVVLMPPTKTRAELHAALGTAHTYISPSFGEGWDLPLFEMMSYGMHTCATSCSAHSFYVSEKSSVVIPTSEEDLVPARDGIFFNGTGSWYVPKEEAVIESLEECIKQFPGKATSKYKALCDNARKSTSILSWYSSAEHLIRTAEKLCQTATRKSL